MDEIGWATQLAVTSPLWWEIPLGLTAYAVRIYLSMRMFYRMQRGLTPNDVAVTEYEIAFFSKTNAMQWTIAHRGAMATATWYWLLGVVLYVFAQHYHWLQLEVQRSWGGLAPWVILLLLHAIYRTAAVATASSFSAAAIAGLTNKDFNRNSDEADYLS